MNSNDIIARAMERKYSYLEDEIDQELEDIYAMEQEAEELAFYSDLYDEMYANDNPLGLSDDDKAEYMRHTKAGGALIGGTLGYMGNRAVTSGLRRELDYLEDKMDPTPKDEARMRKIRTILTGAKIGGTALGAGVGYIGGRKFGKKAIKKGIIF